MINIPGVISVILFYIVILLVGIWAGRKKKTATIEDEDNENFETEEVMLAGRNIGLFVGIFTMTATWVGGGYINGTAEVIYNSGIIWCQAPFGYATSLVIGGFFFANKMREQGYVTMLDPFQEVLGGRMGGLLFLPALCGEVFWSAAILAALGATVSVIVDIDNETSIILSACIALIYTLFGGLYSVAYTDVIQLFCIFVGLWLCIPFSLEHPAVKSMSAEHNDWWGDLPSWQYGQYLDYGLLLVLGGVPWQVYFQRVLSTKSAFKAQVLSYVAAFGCIIMAIPPMIIGAVARVTAWNETLFQGPTPLDKDHESLVLPLVLQYLTPSFVSFVGLGAVSAAVMSSSDSSLLSASSMFARNVYKLMIRPAAPEHEVVWVMRIGIIVVGCVATVMALTVKSIYGLWYLSSDLVYVILFPQLVCVVHYKEHCNTYGSLAAYIVGFSLRALGGEDIMGLPAIIKYPWYDPEYGQLFPFRTFAMLSSFSTLIGISRLTKWGFESGKWPPSYDIFQCVVNVPEDVVKVQDPQEEMTILSTSIAKTYQASEMNGRVNPGLETDDADPAEQTDGRPRKIPIVGSVTGTPASTGGRRTDSIRKQSVVATISNPFKAIMDELENPMAKGFKPLRETRSGATSPTAQFGPEDLQGHPALKGHPLYDPAIATQKKDDGTAGATSSQPTAVRRQNTEPTRRQTSSGAKEEPSRASLSAALSQADKDVPTTWDDSPRDPSNEYAGDADDEDDDQPRQEVTRL